MTTEEEIAELEADNTRLDLLVIHFNIDGDLDMRNGCTKKKGVNNARLEVLNGA